MAANVVRYRRGDRWNNQYLAEADRVHMAVLGPGDINDTIRSHRLSMHLNPSSPQHPRLPLRILPNNLDVRPSSHFRLCLRSSARSPAAANADCTSVTCANPLVCDANKKMQASPCDTHATQLVYRFIVCDLIYVHEVHYKQNQQMHSPAKAFPTLHIRLFFSLSTWFIQKT